MSIRLTRTHIETMIAHARAGLPNEACGILAGSNDAVSAVHCLENGRHSLVEYELTAQGYLLVADLDDAGQLLAVFHSHPRGAAYPSPTDRRQAAWPIRYVIISLQNRQQPVVRAFRMAKRDNSNIEDMGDVVVEELEIIEDGTVNT